MTTTACSPDTGKTHITSQPVPTVTQLGTASKSPKLDEKVSKVALEKCEDAAAKPGDGNKIVAKVAVAKPAGRSRSSSEKKKVVLYTSGDEVTVTILVCEELRALVNNLVTRPSGHIFKSPKVQELFTSLNQTTIEKIKSQEPKVRRTVQLHHKILEGFILLLVNTRKDMNQTHEQMLNDFKEIENLLNKRTVSHDVVEAKDLRDYDSMMNSTDIKFLLATLDSLINIQRRIELIKQQFDVITSNEDSEARELKIKSRNNRYRLVRQELEEIDINKLPKTKPQDIGSTASCLLGELTQTVVDMHEKITEELKLDKKNPSSPNKINAKKHIDITQRLEEEFTANTDFVEKLTKFREYSAKITAFRELIIAENGIQYTLKPDVKKALLKQRLEELEKLKDTLKVKVGETPGATSTPMIELLDKEIADWTDKTKNGNEDIRKMWKMTKTALSSFEALKEGKTKVVKS